jgi:hypothetical protein
MILKKEMYMPSRTLLVQGPKPRIFFFFKLGISQNESDSSTLWPYYAHILNHGDNEIESLRQSPPEREREREREGFLNFFRWLTNLKGYQGYHATAAYVLTDCDETISYCQWILKIIIIIVLYKDIPDQFQVEHTI